MKHSERQTAKEFREQCRRQMERPLSLRIKYGFFRSYRPVLDDAPWRSFNNMAEYRRWCERELPECLGYKRAKASGRQKDRIELPLLESFRREYEKRHSPRIRSASEKAAQKHKK